MTNGPSKSDAPRYRLRFRGGDLVLSDGPRQIEIGKTRRQYENRIEYTLFARTIQQWEYPYSDEPITDELREHILTETKRLLEARDNRVRVTINRTELGGDQW